MVELAKDDRTPSKTFKSSRWWANARTIQNRLKKKIRRQRAKGNYSAVEALEEDLKRLKKKKAAYPDLFDPENPDKFPDWEDGEEF